MEEPKPISTLFYSGDNCRAILSFFDKYNSYSLIRSLYNPEEKVTLIKGIIRSTAHVPGKQTKYLNVSISDDGVVTCSNGKAYNPFKLVALIESLGYTVE